VTSLRARLLGGDRAVGLFVQTPHPVVAEVAGRLGPDVLCLDQEHAPFDIAAVHAVVGGAALAGVPALEVRVLANAIGEPDRSLWRFDEAKALLADALPGLVRELSRA
jgi:2-keto-3-deoxy-L-rhamnonate aldolase RhmA